MTPTKLVPLALLVAACSGAAARPDPPVASAPAGRFQWRGGPTALIERDGLRLLTDPVLAPRGPGAFVLPKHPSTLQPDAPIARYTDPPADPIGHLDLILLSHDHADHFDARAREVLPKDVLFIAPRGAVAAVRGHGFTDVRPLDWGEQTMVEAGAARLRVTAVPAHHAHDADLDAALGKGNGYVLRWEGAAPYSIYWTGDAVFEPSMRETATRFAGVDLWLPHLGAVGVDGPRGRLTMDAEEATDAMAVLRPRRVIPIHHTTFGHYREPVSALVQRAAGGGLGDRISLVGEGQIVALP